MTFFLPFFMLLHWKSSTECASRFLPHLPSSNLLARHTFRCFLSSCCPSKGNREATTALLCAKFSWKLQYISALLVEKTLYANFKLVSCQSRLRTHSKAQHHCLHLLRLDECIMHDKQNIVQLDYSLKQRSTKVHGANINIQSYCRWNAFKYHLVIALCFFNSPANVFGENLLL